MTDILLILNAGSSSIKFALYRPPGNASGLECLFRGNVQNIGADAYLSLIQDELALADTSVGTNTAVKADNHQAAVRLILDWVALLPDSYQLVAAGHRVVHGGRHFTYPVQVDAAVLSRLQELEPIAPLHQPYALIAINQLLSAYPRLPQVACFDTAFHASMPPEEKLFALPRALGEQGIRRYGFHGLSYEYIASVLPDYLNAAAGGKIVVAHLGHGASLCAMQDYKSIATTMSFTPLDGLPMATRCGAIDAAVVLYLLREVGMTLEAVSNLLHRQSGLLGLSGISGDMRTLLASDSPEAAEAVKVFIQRIKREMGSLAAALGGLDALVFCGGIGEHAVPVRAAICRAAAWLGVDLDAAANANVIGDSRISTANSRTAAWVIATDEEQVIARHMLEVLGIEHGSGAAKVVPDQLPADIRKGGTQGDYADETR